jgi:2-dehydro-3-deoxyglucarate aldolase/4-hydroxy-2-oxoheptanedioate aldolase
MPPAQHGGPLWPQDQALSRVTSKIKQLLVEGKLVRVTMAGPLAHPKIIEAVGVLGGFDGIWIDQEHSAIPHQQLEILLLACRASGLDPFVRLAPTDYATVMRPMEAGASGIMAAMVRSAEQAQEIVRWAKYPPVGTRGLFQFNFESRYGTIDPQQHITACNRDRWVSIQIELPEAVEEVERIAQVEGVDWLFVGPGDLACTLGVPGQVLHSKCVSALERVSAACRAAGKPWGTLVRSPEHAAKCRELGCQLFSLASDMDFVQRGLQATRKMYEGMF